MDKQKIRLAREKETLLVPLYSKAVASAGPHPLIADPKAMDVLQHIDYDFAALRIPRQTLLTLAMRAKRLDAYVRDYLDRSEHPLVLHLGCGLDARVLRVGFGHGDWYDVDYPEVIALRRHFFDETDHYHMLPASVTEGGWLDQAGAAGRPGYVVAEGLLMYLQESEVRRLFLDLRDRLPASEIAFDAYSRLTARGVNRHPSVKRTGAQVHWGIDDPRRIEDWGTGIEFLDEWCFTQSADIAALGPQDRLLFRSMGLFAAARRAHRILRYRLNGEVLLRRDAAPSA